MKLTQKSINDVEKKFIELSQKLKEIRQENEFNEIDLNHFELKLTQITKELFTLPSISIEGDSQEFINKIPVHSVVDSYQPKHPTTNTATICKKSTLTQFQFKSRGLGILGYS
ncbi:unnamed protein product [Adineta steineri]|uniref:Uncharacterized protein n=3 Tax=Adineta steineri TaxID=433720 RepID=A0A813S477_9BILA|nr:unnamed protein product [Adineta steineri]CAF3996997.1 unnamed protein product [Adineta steineri]